MTDADVIVVGAGPAGSSTAWHLARAGARVLVLDRARFPRDKPCSEYLSPEASRILEAMGALDACERAGAAHLRGMMVRATDGSWMRGDFAADHGYRPHRDHGLALRRVLLDAILLERARSAGARVLEGVRVTDIVRDASGTVAGVRFLETSGARELRAPLVIGADGLRSVISRRLGVAHTARWPRRLALVSHWRGVHQVGDCGQMHVERDGYAGIAPVGDGILNVAVVVPSSRAREAAGSAARFAERWLREHAHLARRFESAERVTGWRAVGPFAQRARRAWAPGAALVGDAADFFDPFTGEGIFAALRGGEMLAPFALEALGASTRESAGGALAAYDAARRRAFAGKWSVERLVALAVSRPALMTRAVHALRANREMADLFVGVTGDFVPPREVLRAGFVTRLLLGGWRVAGDPAPGTRSPGPRPAIPASRD